jgi:hypothetical protein
MPRQFLYNGYATGFSGRIHAPFDEVIESKAASSLGVIGGYASARVDNFRHRELVSFASAHTQASGILSQKAPSDQNPAEKPPAYFETFVSGVMEGLNILDTVKVDYMVGRLMSKHPVEPPKEGADEPTITPVGSQYGKVMVAGFELTPVIDVDFFNTVCTYSRLCESIPRNADLRVCFKVGEDLPVPPPRGMLVGSIVREVRGGGPGLEIKGNSVRVPGFGTLHFGEFIIEQYSRRLSMMRAELGCPVQLDSSGPDMGGNGIPPSSS